MEERLQKFARLVELKSFTAAARDLHISQPALTLAVHKLERELRSPLLIRGHRKFELTPAGRLAYTAAVEHRTTNDNLRTRLTDLASRRPKVVVGMIDSVAAALNTAAEPLDELEAQADVSIIVNHSRYLRTAVETREIDLAFAVQDSAGHPALDVQPVSVEPFVLVCRPDKKDDFQTALKTKKLPDFISYDRSSTTYGHLHRELRKRGIGTKAILHSTSPDTMLHMALRGRGVAALPYLLTRELLAAGKLTALSKGKNDITLDCPIAAVTRRGRILPEVLATFTKQVELLLRAG